MNEVSARRLEYDRENALYARLISSNDVPKIETNLTTDACWLLAFGRYLKTIRNDSHPICSNPRFYQSIKRILNQSQPITRGLLQILKQCVYLFPGELADLSFQRHLTVALSSLTDPYLKYKYVRLLHLIIDETSLTDILPSRSDLLEKYSQLDISLIIVLEKLVAIHSDDKLQLSINELYPPKLLDYLQSNDFDDDEIIDLCYLLFQINLNKSLHCVYTVPTIFLDLLIYIDYETDTMMNWLLTPETGDKFLIFILRLIKYFSSNRNEFHSSTYRQLIVTMKQFHEQLKTAHEKSLFPYNIKPLLNAFDLF